MREVMARELMEDFAERTGLVGNRPTNRYLWTDAFAVCNLAGLCESTGNQWYARRAEELVEEVHRTLGRHRHDDDRDGWISGLDDEQARQHPTRGGLRIGKPRPERAPEEPYDERGEWNRDGQYFHYLTKWMYALARIAESTDEPEYHRWACELAATACGAFIHDVPGGGSPRVHWKMSIDLTRPLVRSMGQHDPLDGYVTCRQLEATGRRLAGESPDIRLDDEIELLASMFESTDWTTTDPLGLGGLLIDATRLERLRRMEADGDEALIDEVLDTAVWGLERFVADEPWEAPPRERLPFRELGLAVGLAGVERLELVDRHPGLESFVPLGERLASYWTDQKHHEIGTWTDRRNINGVMLATALAPRGFFGPRPRT